MFKNVRMVFLICQLNYTKLHDLITIIISIIFNNNVQCMLFIWCNPIFIIHNHAHVYNMSNYIKLYLVFLWNNAKYSVVQLTIINCNLQNQIIIFILYTVCYFFIAFIYNFSLKFTIIFVWTVDVLFPK